jgi:hypothetical protein
MTGRMARLVGAVVHGRAVGGWAVSSSAVVLRAVVLATGWLALLLAVPSPVIGYAPAAVVAVAGVLAAAATFVPRRHAVLILELGVVALWLSPGGHARPTPVLAVVLGAMLYVHHATASLASATGWDVRVTGDLARAWSVRVVVTVVAASVLSTLSLALTAGVGRATPDWVLLAGLVAAVVAVAVPLARVRRPTEPGVDVGPGVSGRTDVSLD